jgi:hypothetical protein
MDNEELIRSQRLHADIVRKVDTMNAAGMIVLVQKMVIPYSTPSFLLRPLTNQTSETLFKCVLLP